MHLNAPLKLCESVNKHFKLKHYTRNKESILVHCSLAAHCTRTCTVSLHQIASFSTLLPIILRGTVSNCNSPNRLIFIWS